jgi:hypothetical protein
MRVLGGNWRGLLLLVALLVVIVLAYPPRLRNPAMVVASVFVGALMVPVSRVLVEAVSRGHLASSPKASVDDGRICPSCGAGVRRYAVSCGRCGTVFRRNVILAYSGVVLALLVGTALWQVGSLNVYTALALLLLLLVAGLLLCIGHVPLNQRRK